MGDGRPVYVLTFLTGSVLTENGTPVYYILQIPSGNGFTAGGGDESKKQWFIRIAGTERVEFLSVRR